MRNRLKHSMYLAPAIFLLLIWIAAAPGLVAQQHPWIVVAYAVASALVAAWFITLFAQALKRDKT